MAKLISKTYGEALFETALEVNQVDGLFEEAEMLKKILAENPKLLELFDHPNIMKEEKLKVLKTIFEGRISKEMEGFLQVVLEKGRQKELDATLDYFIAKVKEYKKIGIVFVTSACELTEAQKAQITEKLLQTTRYETLEMHYSVDPELIGGLMIRIGDRVVDSSIRNRLWEMKKELMKIQLG